ncbi:MAG TPA: imidazole glycerol phosphate synthase subunit HisH [Gemmatimonadaceae bacterium]|nr:imidazole glycerol phosphate synthase subunit HisH [Gemmatimonadaceae bacterium]
MTAAATPVPPAGTAPTVAVIDYGMGNIGSICKMLRVVGATPVVTADPDAMSRADKVLLPGVGHFDRAMANLTELGLVEPIRRLALEEAKPILGICLGMQLLCRGSEEGTQPGLGLLDARVRRFEFSGPMRLKVPHMGWTELLLRKASPLMAGLDAASRFYFVHSFFVECADPSDVLAEATYGVPFVAAFELANVRGVQFHPEKSHRFGIQMFRNFVQSTQ